MSRFIHVGLLSCLALLGPASARAETCEPATTPDRCAEQALRAWLARGYVHFEISPLTSTPARTHLNAGETVRPRPVAWSGVPTRRMTVWVDVLSQVRVLRAIPVAFEVHAYSQGWQATQDLRPSSAALELVALTQATVDVTSMEAAPWHGPVEGYRLRKPLLAGQVLTAAHIERVTAVTRGQPVEVLTSVGELRIDAQAQALQDGQVGDLVQVRVARSAAAVLGRVTGPGAVEVVR